MDEKLRFRLHSLTSQRAIAAALGVTPQAVNLWFNKSGIPPRFVLAVCELVNWEITPHDLAPALYPHVSDGLPKRAADKA
ncbi:helix-turn-helix domain-containing protein [Salmonella enterica]|nr:helix-turn-helix domain-containing protein [Salmonella enterica]